MKSLTISGKREQLENIRDSFNSRFGIIGHISIILDSEGDDSVLNFSIEQGLEKQLGEYFEAFKSMVANAGQAVTVVP